MAYGNFITARPSLILLSGVPGSGKTTFARALAGVLDFENIESDAIRRSMARSPTYSPGESGAVFALVDSRARQAIKAGRHALVDATNLTTRDRKRFLAVAHELGARLIAIRLVAPESTIRTRLGRPREGHSQAGIDVFEKMKDRAQLFAAPAIVVDTRFPLEPAVTLTASLANAADG